ncbi:unnamed protein product [Polarella glacialis]|uniref:Protein kinase domain-containing protein n=1 Tax=Polarella glacialis TaxID=89957 RepID=A0A813L946_POLGL|nr:unnamed protein product [Polarella glacialis]
MDERNGAKLMTTLLPPATFGSGRYERRAVELGRGASSRVFECSELSSDGSVDVEKQLAVKVMHLRSMRLSATAERDLHRLHRELAILRSLPPHPRIVKLVDGLEEGDWYFLVLELIRGGDMFGVLKARSGPRACLLEPEASHVFWQLVDGLAFLHGRGIIHRDLKLENTLIESEKRKAELVLYSIKISDFGLSMAVHAEAWGTFSTVGTQRYVAPEVLAEGEYDFRVDLWSLGILLHILLVGSYPTDRPTDAGQALLDSIVAGMDVSAVARSMVAGLLRLDPARRTTTEQLLAGGERAWSGNEGSRGQKHRRDAKKGLVFDLTLPEVSQMSMVSSGLEEWRLPPPAPGGTPSHSLAFAVSELHSPERRAAAEARVAVEGPLPSTNFLDSVSSELRQLPESSHLSKPSFFPVPSAKEAPAGGTGEFTCAAAKRQRVNDDLA